MCTRPTVRKSNSQGKPSEKAPLGLVWLEISFGLRTLRAPERWLPPPLQEPPDLERLSRLAAKPGVTILGPPPRPVEGGGDENPAN